MIFPKDPKKVVGIDIDDVLADFITPFITKAHEKFGIPADTSQRPVDWGWSNMGWTREMIDSVWQDILDTPNFWLTLPVLKGVDPFAVTLLDRSTKVYFPTARAVVKGMDVGKQSAVWLAYNFDISYPTVIVGDQKGPLANALKYDYFIDDRPKNCLDVKKARPECKVFIKDTWHNQAFSDPDIPRVSGIGEFSQIVLEGE